MIYSSFDERAGLYRYYTDHREHPVNADLPVPSMPADAGRIGVPARECGRELPADARPAGSGWHARGLVVQPTRSSSPGLGEASGAPPAWRVGVGVALAALVIWGVSRYSRSR